MRHLFATALITGAALVAGPVQAADLPQYVPPIAVPSVPVDYGLGGSFYLRGSVGANASWARDVSYRCACGTSPIYNFDKAGYGYSIGAGFGYETGSGLRFDATVDYLANDGLYASLDPGHQIDVSLRSTIALANAYYDFGFNGQSSAAGGLGGYVGAGIGGAYNQFSDNDKVLPAASGNSFTAAAAVMAGVSYDMGSMVADLGYRGIYMPNVTNGSLNDPYLINDEFISEIRASLRYRLN